MTKLRVGYVPEHFSSPLLQLAQTDSSIELVSQPSGTGQIQKSLAEGKIDIAIALTEALIAGIVKKVADYKLVGSYVSTPLNWAVITGKDSKYNSIQDLRGTKIGISRIGSGSQIMASVMALQHHWYSDEATQQVEPLQFQVLDTFKGLRDGVNSGAASCFMWEWFTTKPYVDSGEVRFIGNVLTPWPSWHIAAAAGTDKEAVANFLNKLDTFTSAFDSIPNRQGPNIEFIKKQFGYEEADIEAWLNTVSYAKVPTVSRDVVFETLKTLEVAGVVKQPAEGWSLSTFVDGV